MANDTIRPHSPEKFSTILDSYVREQLTADQFFFYQNAGYSYAKTQTPEQGRIRCAKDLAVAETVAQRLGYEFEWEFDECLDLSWMSDDERQRGDEILCCRIFDPENPRYSPASLCGITDPDRNYRRVVEAELAAEAIADVDRQIEIPDAH